MSPEMMEKMQNMADSAPIGATMKFVMGSKIFHIDGTGAKNEFSQEDKPADCTVSMSEDAFEKLIDGSLNPMMAVMTGKIKITGDMSVAMKLQSLLS